MLVVDGKTATQVSETLLELTAKAMLRNDFDAFAPHFHLPHTIETPDKKTILKTRNALQSVFDTVVEDYANRQVTDLVRFCEVAEYRGPFKIEATHITHMMAGNHRVTDPFPSFSVLEFIDNRWQCTSSQYAVDRTTTVGRALDAGVNDSNTRPRVTFADAVDKRKN